VSVNAQKTPALAGLPAVLVVVDYQMAPKLVFVLEFLRQLLQLRFSCSKTGHYWRNGRCFCFCPLHLWGPVSLEAVHMRRHSLALLE
jgi:hypothetical protein